MKLQIIYKFVTKGISDIITSTFNHLSSTDKLNEPEKVDVYVYTSTDGTNKLVAVFEPKPETNYKNILTPETPLFDVVVSTSMLVLNKML